MPRNNTATIKAIPRVDNLQLSFAQERLWILDQLEPDSPAYNIPLAIQLKGELSVTALVKSLNEIVHRQETLRTRFAIHQGAPVQIIDDVEIELVQDDLSALTSATLEHEVEALIIEEALQPFNLETLSLPTKLTC